MPLACIEPVDIRKKNGVVYTPSKLASYVALKTVQYFIKDLTKNEECERKSREGNNIKERLTNLKIIDPACGQGELLVAVWGELIKARPDNKFIINPKLALCGVDIDEEAIKVTRQRIACLDNNLLVNRKFNLVQTNALFPINSNSPTEGWSVLKSIFGAINGFDILIANPPWGADTSSYANKLLNGHFSLHKGQFDTSDLFIELALSIVRENGYFAFIIPDSLFSMERKSLRKLILENTEIKFIGRFGEKIFDNVNRACAVLICKKTRRASTAKIDCLRLTPELRKSLLCEKITFHDIEKSLMHKVNPARLKHNNDYSFDIDVKEEEEDVVERLKRHDKTLRDYAFSSRGVELSKSGKICKCPTVYSGCHFQMLMSLNAHIVNQQ